ncbi:hypothetical protein K431DRAFT_59487 [Polychaeton citri CBS 116435]|uniref:Mso1 N-terminal domain-containing protein n=1 Tax=Polychaeton citri CBS 116435 TaxID=1314669 RepID=A0A9P4Q9H1_9PEZI|nr:hypothetical protein K431DRAFT_59487 [Polychaeton citri CBS 116435]
MSSYLSNLLTSTTSRYNSIRRNLLDNEGDGDTEDDTHISRVLRGYYNEKGRPYPPWLPPDPKEKKAAVSQPVYGQQPGGYLGNRNQYGSSGQAHPGGGGGGGRAGLGDLWDTPANRNSAPAAAAPQSLRAGRRPLPGAAATGNSSNLAPPQQARPLPSQRAGSYQNPYASQSQQGPSNPSPAPSSGSGTAQDRLKARLWGGRASPLPSPSAGQTQNPMDQYGNGGGSGGYRKYG